MQPPSVAVMDKAWQRVAMSGRRFRSMPSGSVDGEARQ